MTAGTVVIEAGWRSGARNTASHAANLVRPVGAVPGPVTSAASAGCHRLLREGIGTCVCDADDIAELIGPITLNLTEPPSPVGLLDGLTPPERQVLDALPICKAATTESVASSAGVSARQVLAALGSLERAGLVQRKQGSWMRANK